MPTNPPPNRLFSGVARRLMKQILQNPFTHATSVELDWIERRKLRHYDVLEPDVEKAIATLLHIKRMPIRAQVEQKRSRLTGKLRYARIKVTAGSAT